MPRYLALSDGYLGRRPGFVTKGTQFDYDGKPGKWMLLVGPATPATPGKPLSRAEQAKADKETAKAAKAGAEQSAGNAAGKAPEGSGSGDKDVI